MSTIYRKTSGQIGIVMVKLVGGYYTLEFRHEIHKLNIHDKRVRQISE